MTPFWVAETHFNISKTLLDVVFNCYLDCQIVLKYVSWVTNYKMLRTTWSKERVRWSKMKPLLFFFCESQNLFHFIWISRSALLTEGNSDNFAVLPSGHFKVLVSFINYVTQFKNSFPLIIMFFFILANVQCCNHKIQDPLPISLLEQIFFTFLFLRKSYLLTKPKILVEYS